MTIIVNMIPHISEFYAFFIGPKETGTVLEE